MRVSSQSLLNLKLVGIFKKHVLFFVVIICRVRYVFLNGRGREDGSLVVAQGRPGSSSLDRALGSGGSGGGGGGGYRGWNAPG